MTKYSIRDRANFCWVFFIAVGFFGGFFICFFLLMVFCIFVCFIHFLVGFFFLKGWGSVLCIYVLVVVFLHLN